MPDYRLPAHADVLSRDIGIREFDSKVISNVTIK